MQLPVFFFLAWSVGVPLAVCVPSPKTCPSRYGAHFMAAVPSNHWNAFSYSHRIITGWRGGAATPGRSPCSPTPAHSPSQQPELLQAVTDLAIPTKSPGDPLPRLLLRACTGPLLLAVLQILAFWLSRHSRFRVNEEDMQGSLVLEDKQWHRLFTSLFTFEHKLDVALSCLATVTAGTLCAAVYGQLGFISLFLVSGLSGNLLKLGMDWLGRRMSSRFWVTPIRERLGARLGDPLHLGPSLTSASASGAVLGLVAAAWSVALREAGVKDLRTLPPIVKSWYNLNFTLAVLFGTACGSILPLELLLPRFGKAQLFGAVFGSLILSAILPYRKPSALLPLL